MQQVRRGLTLGLVWLAIFAVSFLAAEASIVLQQDEESPTLIGPVLIYENVIHWHFDTRSNYTRNQTWTIAFDDMFPEDSFEYTVFPKFFAGPMYDAGGSEGWLRVIIDFYLNDVWLWGSDGSLYFEGTGGLRVPYWIPHESDIEVFSNATPKDSGNVFEVRLDFSSNITDPGDGRIDVVAGPLLLYANRLPVPEDSSHDVLVVAVVSAILALPATLVAMFTLRRLQEEPPRKKLPR